MSKTFTVKIEIGNVAMETPAQVAAALEQIAHELRGAFGFHQDYSANIRDVNGNTVGKYTTKGVK